MKQTYVEDSHPSDNPRIVLTVMFGHSIPIVRTDGENVFDYFKEAVDFGHEKPRP